MTQELLDGSVISDVSWYLALPMSSWCVSKSQGRSGDNPFHVLSLSPFSSWYNDIIDIVKVSIDGGTPIAAEFIVQHPI